MKKAIGIVFFFLLAGSLVFGQWSGYYVPEGTELDAGLGMTWIDNQAYYTISFHPDISIGKFGIGLGLNLLYNADTGRIRPPDWDSGYDYARILRYLRYGHKGDRLYSRIGALDVERLGHGFILNLYNNQLNYDERKLGLILDADLGWFGFESLTNNLGRFEVLGGRAYLRPFNKSPMAFLKHLAVGGTYVADVDPDQWRGTDDGIAVWGADVEIFLKKTDAWKIMLYGDHAQIQDYGSGQAVGFRTDYSTLRGWFRAGVNVERRFLGKEFIASYFGPFYEILRHTTLGELIEFYESLGGDSLGIPKDVIGLIGDFPVNQQMLLPMMTEKRNGWYAALTMEMFKVVRVMGFYQKVDGQDKSGMLHLGAGLSESVPFLAVEATYDKWGIGSFKDIRTLNYQSLARVGVGWKIKPYLLLYMDYIWNFVWDEELEQYKPQERFQPRLAFRYAIGGF